MAETAEQPTEDAKPTREGFVSYPKRVILRLRVDEFDDCSPLAFDRAIVAYLESTGRSGEELDRGIHCSHIEPLQPPEMGQTWFHIILDIEKDMLKEPELDKVEHEVHRVRRAKNGTFSIKRIANAAEEKNLIHKMRCFTDVFYQWGK